MTIFDFRQQYHDIEEKNEVGVIQKRRIAYTDWGDVNNKRVLICVHGLIRNSRDFDYLADKLKDIYRVIAIDIAGRGKSDPLQNKALYAYPQYIADVTSVIQSLGVDKVDWLGTSMGGLTAMFLSLSQPDLIRKLVLNDIGPFISGVALQKIARYVSIKPYFDSYEQACNHLTRVYASFGIKTQEHWQHFFENSIHHTGDSKFALNYDARIGEVFKNLDEKGRIIEEERPIGDFEIWSVWDKLKAKIMVVRGETSDILLPQTLEKMKKNKNLETIIEVQGAGHAPSLMEQAQIQAIRRWLVS